MVRSSDEKAAAISAAREVFWTKGYEETSVEALVAATGLNRYALYSAFGGKLDLFLAVLDDYQRERREMFMSNLNDETIPPLKAVERVFEHCTTRMDEYGAGCLLGNVAGVVARTEPLVAERIKEHFNEITWAHTEALKRAAKRGELNPAISPKEGGKLLVTLILGLGTGVEHVNSLEDSQTSFRAALNALAPPVPDAGAKIAKHKKKKTPNRSKPYQPPSNKKRQSS